MTGSRPQVAVIIAAYNVVGMIGQAIDSALQQPETAEVVVVDDASRDGTADAAEVIAGRDSRVRVIRNQQNSGPSKARNIAIAATRAPFIAILDGDDMFLPGRFAAMFALGEWDFCADNIVFFANPDQLPSAIAGFAADQSLSMTLDCATFIEGNIPDVARPRGELGFLKPVIRRKFLERNAITYREDCRLGEDFILYVEALAKGARYQVLSSCGYAALVREDSLSAAHSVDDLLNLCIAEAAILQSLELNAQERATLRRRHRSTERRLNHRLVLESKAREGLIAGLATGLSHPQSLLDIARDRWRKFGTQPPAPAIPRKLLQSAHFIPD
jgi:succinoglycan biosynthesis protein ExoU